VRRIVAVSLLSVVVYLAVTAVQVGLASRQRPAQRADAIVVLGAAQYDGTPSPALKARLDRAADLFKAGIGPQGWATRGGEPGHRLSEASASDLYLPQQGVPREALRLAVHGGNTYESLAAAARFLRQDDARRVMLISDAWHSYRLVDTAEELGLIGYVSPPRSDPMSATAIRRVSRETMLVAVGRIIGYRRLSRLQDRVA